MQKMCLIILLCAFLAVCGFAIAASSDLESNQESGQRIASMELNQSAGNMTGEDYIIAMVYAGINDMLNDYHSLYSSESTFSDLREEASDKFPEYRDVYENSLLSSSISNIGHTTPPGPSQDLIDLLIYEIFHNESELRIVYPHTGSSVGLSGSLKKARSDYEKRVVEEAALKAKREKKEADRLLKQQENEARQAALDAHYKDLFDNTTRELERLEDKSRNTTDNSSKEAYCQDALRLLNNSSAYLVSPYSNMLSMSAGNILIEMSRLSDDHHKNLLYIVAAGECYRNAQNNFTYSNGSEDYQNAIHQDFLDDWDRMIQMRTGIAEDRLKEELYAMVTDLKDAPNAKQLLSGHINKKYDVTVMNYTEPMFIKFLRASDYPYTAQPGYWVQVNISGYNDPESGNIDGYVTQNIPICIDIFSSLFSDERISVAYVQLNETYNDRFGHTEERSVMSARLDNVTATEIGDWPAFKKYVGKDMSKFRQAVDVNY